MSNELLKHEVAFSTENANGTQATVTQANCFPSFVPRPSLLGPAFAHRSPLAARCTLLAIVAMTALLATITLSPYRSGFADAPRRNAGDVALYQAEVVRLQAGQSYYSAASVELTARGYPTRSLLNWRTPLPMWLVGVLPSPWFARLLLMSCSALVFCLATHLIAKQYGLAAAALVVVLLGGGLMPALLDPIYIMPEVWAGVLIALSILLTSDARPLPWRAHLAIVAGLAALFVRELAAPYCMLSLCFAIKERRHREAGLWIAGLLTYAAFYAWHISHVLPLIASDAIAHPQGWLRMGGAAFVISLVQMNAYLLLLPQWLSAVYLMLALVGFAAGTATRKSANRKTASWNTLAAWTACCYVVLFGFVGQPFNQYWGSLLAPLLCLGVAQAPAALRDLWLQARFYNAAWEVGNADDRKSLA